MSYSEKIHNLVIIGSGPAGYTAAVYAARAQLSPLVFEGTQFGGALMTTTEVENYPGFSKGITGPVLMNEMREQALKFGAYLYTENVESINLSSSIKLIIANGKTYKARAVILAMGSAARCLNVPGENNLLGKGVSTCATCDGFFFRGQDILIVGGGDSAMEEANFLTRFANSVTLIHRRNSFKASKIMLKRAKLNKKISFMTNQKIIQINGDSRVASVDLEDTITGNKTSINTAGVFIAIGHNPRSELIQDQVELNSAGYVKVLKGTTATNLNGVYAAGDLVDYTYRQAITAAGSGCAAAIDVERWLSTNKLTCL